MLTNLPFQGGQSLQCLRRSTKTVSCGIIGAGVVLVLLLRDFSGIFWIGGALIACGEIALHMASMQCSWYTPKGFHKAIRKRFLWICHTDDWNEVPDNEYGSPDNVRRNFDEQMCQLREDMDDLNDKMDCILDLLEASAAVPTQEESLANGGQAAVQRNTSRRPTKSPRTRSKSSLEQAEQGPGSARDSRQPRASLPLRRGSADGGQGNRANPPSRPVSPTLLEPTSFVAEEGRTKHWL